MIYDPFSFVGMWPEFQYIVTVASAHYQHEQHEEDLTSFRIDDIRDGVFAAIDILHRDHYDPREVVILKFHSFICLPVDLSHPRKTPNPILEMTD